MQEPPARGSGGERFSEWHHNTQETRRDQTFSVGNRPAKPWRVIVRNSTSCYPEGGSTFPSIQPSLGLKLELD